MASPAATALEPVERQWVLANPQGQSEQAPNGALALWNFAIGSADLKPEHEAALRAFVQVRVLARSVTSFVVSGFTSPTGPELANDALALRRAETVVRWLEALGFAESIVAPNPGAHPIPGEDGRSLARNRRVEVLSYDPFPPSPPAPVAPEFIADRVTATTTPTVDPPAPPGPSVEQELPAPAWLPQRFAAGFTFPDADVARFDNEWVKVRFRFEGALRLAGGDRRSAGALTAMAKEANRVEVSLNYAVADWLAARVLYEQPNVVSGGTRPNVRAGVTATSRNVELGLQYELEASVQPLRFPDRFVYVSAGVTSLLPVTLFGQQVTVAVTGKLKAEGRPGPGTLRLAARIGTAAGAAVPYVAAWLILNIAVIYAIAGSVEAARQAGLRHAQHIAARDAFAARVAFEVVGQTAQGELESLIGEWRRFLDPEVSATAGRCYGDAGGQIERLRSAGQLDAVRAECTARYGQEPGGQADISFTGVRLRIFETLGGYAAEGPTSFTLDRLR